MIVKDFFPVPLFVRIDAVDRKIFDENQKRAKPVACNRAFAEVFFYGGYVPAVKRMLVSSPNLVCNATIKVDERIVGERIPGDEHPARFE